MPETWNNLLVIFENNLLIFFTKPKSVKIFVKIKKGNKPGNTQLAKSMKPFLTLVLYFAGLLIKIIIIDNTKIDNKIGRKFLNLFLFVLLFLFIKLLLILDILKFMQGEKYNAKIT